MNEARSDAISKGHARYEGRQCPKCGETTRYVLNDNCVSCASRHVKTHRLKIKKMIETAKRAVK
jgi:transcription initiation factor IIE alpha subunit